MNETAASSPEIQSSLGALGGSLVALLLVIGLILLLAWLLRRLQGVAQRQHEELRIVASLTVGMRERVLVVAVGEQQLVLGVTAERISLLHTLQQPISVGQPADFSRWLSKAKKAAEP